MPKKNRQAANSTGDSGSRSPQRTITLVKQVQYNASVRLEAALRPLGVTTTQFRILTALSHGGKRSSAELSRMFGVKPQTMIKQIAFLQERGFIDRNLGKGNMRVLEVTTTEAGRQTLRACEKAATAVETTIFACLEPGELESYRALMQKVLGGMRPKPDSGTE